MSNTKPITTINHFIILLFLLIYKWNTLRTLFLERHMALAFGALFEAANKS